MHFYRVWRFAVIFAVIFVPFVARAQFPPVPKDDLSMTADPKAPGADAVYLYREETEDDPHSFRTVYARIKVLTDAGKSAAIVHVSFPTTFVFYAQGSNYGGSAVFTQPVGGFGSMFTMPSLAQNGEDQPWDTDSYVGKTEIAAIEGRVIHPDGTVVPLPGKSADVLRISKGPRGTETTFVMPGVEVGSVIEYRYQIRYDRFLTAPDWDLQKQYFIHKERFVFTPASALVSRTYSGGAGVADSMVKDSHDNILTDIRYKLTLPDGKNLVQDAAGKYALEMTDVPAIPQEAFAPPVDTEAYSVDFFYTYTPDVKDYWQKQMGYWTKAVNQYTSTTDAIQSAIREVVSPSDSQLEKARKLYELVQKIENTDSNPEGAPLTGSEFIPRGKVDAVLINKKGSSNQIAFLYLALLRAAGISARPERLASRSLRVFSAQYMDNIQLDTVLVALKIDGKEIVVDPGTRMAPFGTLHWAHAGAGGVAMDGNKAEIIVTPLQKNTENSTLHVGTLNVAPNGTVSGNLKVAFLGQRAIELRQMALKSGAEAVKSEVNGMIAERVPAGIQASVDHLAYLDDPSRQLLAVVSVSGAFAKNSQGRIVLPRMFFEAQEKNPFPEERARELPIDVRYPAQEQEQITYVLPPGFSLDETPQDASLKWQENAVFQLRTKVEGSSVTDARILARGFTLLDAKEYGGLREFYQKVITADQQQLVLNASQANRTE